MWDVKKEPEVVEDLEKLGFTLTMWDVKSISRSIVVISIAVLP